MEITEARDWRDDLERILEDYRHKIEIDKDERDGCRPWWKGIRLEDILLKRKNGVCELEEALAGLLEGLEVLLAQSSHD